MKSAQNIHLEKNVKKCEKSDWLIFIKSDIIFKRAVQSMNLLQSNIKHAADLWNLNRCTNNKRQFFNLQKPDNNFELEYKHWEFDPGSGWTLAACLIHASRTR